MANFVTVGSRIINLDLVCGAERRDQGKVALYLAAPNSGSPVIHWVFDDREGAGSLWNRLVSDRPDLARSMDVSPSTMPHVEPSMEDMLPMQTD